MATPPEPISKTETMVCELADLAPVNFTLNSMEFDTTAVLVAVDGVSVYKVALVSSMNCETFLPVNSEGNSLRDPDRRNRCFTYIFSIDSSAILTDPLTDFKLTSYSKVTLPPIYKSPHVNKDYIWKYSVRYNC